MVQRCMGTQCVDHPENCKCPFCELYKEKNSGSTVVVTEQGIFGDLSDEWTAVSNPSSKPTK